jgi:hypothetical protein
VQGAIEVRNRVVLVFEPDGKPDEIVPDRLPMCALAGQSRPGCVEYSLRGYSTGLDF